MRRGQDFCGGRLDFAKSIQQDRTTVMIPFIDRLRATDEFAGKPAVLPMDVAAFTREQRFSQLCQPQPTEIFQAVNLSLFGDSKKKMRDKLSFDNGNRIRQVRSKGFRLVEANIC
jgi:hypothetical protein